MTKVFRDSEWDRDGVIEGILGDIPIPKMAKVRQLFDETKIEDIPGAIEAEFNKPEIASSIKKDASVTITAGSRGIANLALIIREVVKNVKRLAEHTPLSSLPWVAMVERLHLASCRYWRGWALPKSTLVLLSALQWRRKTSVSMLMASL